MRAGCEWRDADGMSGEKEILAPFREATADPSHHPAGNAGWVRDDKSVASRKREKN